MTAKHTPGPWVVLPEEADKDYLRIRGTRLSCRYKVANVHMPRLWESHDVLRDRENAESWANARLIAAAPELLEALEEAENALADYIPTIERTGASLNYGHSVLKKARAAIAKATGDES